MNRRRLGAIFIVILASFAIVKSSTRTVAAEAGAKEEILKVDEERNQALQKGDVATLDRIYSDDLVYANATGALLTKAQHLADLKGRALNFKSFQHDDVQVTVHGDTGILTGISTSAVEFHGTVSSSPRRFLNVFVKKDGRWFVVAHFETPVVSH
jgi:ketosteroid isomerase-like protein